MYRNKTAENPSEYRMLCDCGWLFVVGRLFKRLAVLLNNMLLVYFGVYLFGSL